MIILSPTLLGFRYRSITFTPFVDGTYALAIMEYMSFYQCQNLPSTPRIPNDYCAGYLLYVDLILEHGPRMMLLCKHGQTYKRICIIGIPRIVLLRDLQSMLCRSEQLILALERSDLTECS